MSFRFHNSNVQLSSAPSSLPMIDSTQSTPLMRRKVIILLSLLLCLYKLTDSDYHTLHHDNSVDSNQQAGHAEHLAYVTALSRHPPSLRVFRLLFEMAFLLFCSSLALYVWETNDDLKFRVGDLLFCSPLDTFRTNNAFFVYMKKRHLEKRHGRINYEKESKSNAEEFAVKEDEIQSTENDDIELSIVHDFMTTETSWEQVSYSPSYHDSPQKNNALANLHTSNDTPKDLDELHLLQDRRKDDGENERDATANTADKDYVATDQPAIINAQQISPQNTISTKSLHQYPRPPSSQSVLGAALDVSILTIFFLICFTISSSEGGRYIDYNFVMNNKKSDDTDDASVYSFGRDEKESEESTSYVEFFADIAAPLFPLTLFLTMLFMVIVPWSRKVVLWATLSFTIGAPFYNVTFRDGFVGDILTSIIRPLHDLVFTLFFLPLGLRAWWSHSYTMDAAAIPVERTWLVHTVLLPASTLSPYWWRFLQNLRQCFDAKQRWPYLGNAMKYLAAAGVAAFGIYDPSIKKHPLWIISFLMATMYQVGWDVFMDWGLLELDISYGQIGHENKLFPQWPFSLRPKRLYKKQWVYYVIFFINFILRFVGMITLIPPVYLSRATGLIVQTYSHDFHLLADPLIACCEIFRRTIWGLLRLEWEVIKTSADQLQNDNTGIKHVDGSVVEGKSRNRLVEEKGMKPMPIASLNRGWQTHDLSWPLKAEDSYFLRFNDMSELNDIQILSELCVWAVVFTGIVIVAAAHREIL